MQIDKIVLLTNKLEEQRDFYRKILKLPVEEFENKIIVTTGKSKVVFEKSSTPAYYHFAFNIPSNQIQDAVEWLEPKIETLTNRGKKIVNFKAWEAAAVYFHDPAGNIVEFIARKPAKIADDKEFNENSIKYISEIGVAVRNVKYHFDHLNLRHNVPFYSGNTHDFCAAGDAEGLFILVLADSKYWMPTELNAKRFPLTAYFKTTGGLKEYKYEGES